MSDKRQDNFKELLSSKLGKELMSDLMQRCQFLTTATSGNLEFREGQRDIFLYLFKLANFNELNLVDLAKKSEDHIKKETSEAEDMSPYQKMLKGV